MISLSTKASAQKYIKEQREYRVKYTQALHEKIKDLGNQEQAVLAGQSASDLDIIYKELKHNVNLLKKIKGKMMFKPLAVKEDCYEDLNAIQIALTNKLGFKPSMAMTISHVAKEFKRKNKKLFGVTRTVKSKKE
tara:strand:- start:2695 stop:3099 length:405 start_codon:yes stop_codon:yes gene_type:complete